MQYNIGITTIYEPLTNDLEACSRVNDRLENEWERKMCELSSLIKPL